MTPLDLVLSWRPKPWFLVSEKPGIIGILSYLRKGDFIQLRLCATKNGFKRVDPYVSRVGPFTRDSGVHHKEVVVETSLIEIIDFGWTSDSKTSDKEEEREEVQEFVEHIPANEGDHLLVSTAATRFLVVRN